MSNVYYNPTEFGLVLFGILDEDGLSYEYNMLIVLKHVETGRVFYAQDSGCSCPTPFEDYFFRSVDDNDLSEIKPGAAFESFERSVQAFPTGQYERNNLIDLVRGLVKPVPVPVLECGDSSVAQLLRAFSEGDFEALHPLSDALDEAGLPNYANACREAYEKRVGIAEMTRRLVGLTPAYQETFGTQPKATD